MSAPVIKSDHRVLVYRHDAELVAAVGDFAAGALAGGGAAVLLATGSHLAGAERWADLLGAGIGRAESDRRYHRLDLAHVLPAIERAADPLGALEAIVLDVIGLVPPGARPIRVFGEVAAHLWERGDIAGAVGVEGVGTRLSAERGLEILCAYPETALAGDGDVERVCSCHTGTFHPGPVPSVDPAGPPVLASSPFPATPTSCRAVRRLVRSAFSELGLDGEVIDNAELVASELAANAVRHVGGPFSVLVTHAGYTAVRVAVTDPGPAPTGSAGMPVSRSRGLGIVATLSSRWGVEQTDGGKVVWAEIPR